MEVTAKCARSPEGFFYYSCTLLFLPNYAAWQMTYWFFHLSFLLAAGPQLTALGSAVVPLNTSLAFECAYNASVLLSLGFHSPRLFWVVNDSFSVWDNGTQFVSNVTENSTMLDLSEYTFHEEEDSANVSVSGSRQLRAVSWSCMLRLNDSINVETRPLTAAVLLPGNVFVGFALIFLAFSNLTPFTAFLFNSARIPIHIQKGFALTYPEHQGKATTKPYNAKDLEHWTFWIKQRWK